MLRKYHFSVLLLLLLIVSVGVGDAQDIAEQALNQRSELKLAAWNIRNLSHGNRTDAELRKIVKILIDYDFIAISELLDEKVLKRIQRFLSESGAEYDYQISDPVGHEDEDRRERYAFLYYKGLVNVIRDGELYPDAADGNPNDFVRDPYWATFRAGEFDFSVIVVHVDWDDAVAVKRAEIMKLAAVYQHVQEANGDEDDVLLVGDFNRNPDDEEAYGELLKLPSMTHLFRLPQKSHIKDSSLYDNIFFQKDYVTEYAGRSGIDKFDETDFGNDDDAASRAVSDHRPVWAVFRIDGGLDVPREPLVFGEKPKEEPQGETETVYITQTGKKYHRDGCSALRRSKKQIALTEAKQKGYGPCSRCNP